MFNVNRYYIQINAFICENQTLHQSKNEVRVHSLKHLIEHVICNTKFDKLKNLMQKR